MDNPPSPLGEFPRDPLAILYLALRSPLGVLVKFSGKFEVARGKFYSARNAAGDVELSRLSIREAEEGHLAIVKEKGE